MNAARVYGISPETIWCVLHNKRVAHAGADSLNDPDPSFLTNGPRCRRKFLLLHRLNGYRGNRSSTGFGYTGRPVPRSRSLPPVECCPGTIASHADIWRAVHAVPLPTATMAVATTGPTPSTFSIRWLRSSSLNSYCSSWS